MSSQGAGPSAPAGERPRPSLAEIFWTFGYVGAISFGGGAIGYLRQTIVREKGWLNDEEFLSGVELCQTLPGLIAANMCVYVGERLRGSAGAAAAVIGLSIPGLVVVMTLGLLYSANRQEPSVKAALDGVSAAATGFLFAVAVQLGKKHLTKPVDLIFVVTTFVTMSLLKLPLIVILLVLGGLGIWRQRPRLTVSQG